MHSAYYGVTGLWPLIHMSSFEALLGKKREHWLVQTVSLLMLSVAGGLTSSTRSVPRPLALTAGLAAAGMGAIGMRYGSSGRISRLYMADALLQYVLAAMWLASMAQSDSAMSRTEQRDQRERDVAQDEEARGPDQPAEPTDVERGADRRGSAR
jgi:hypothetical protein